MLNYVVFDNQIKVWWDYIKLQKDKVYSVFLDGKKLDEIKETNFSFKNLKPNTSYKIAIQIGDEIVGKDIVKTNKRKKRINVTKAPYNAVGDGKTLNTASIQKAIDDCKEGECVFIPKGVYLSGALFLHSDMELLLDKKAVLQGTSNPDDYPKIASRFEGIEDECYSSIINVGVMDKTKGYTCENVVIRGGTIFGGGNALRKNIIEKEKAFFQELYRKTGATEQEVLSNYDYNFTFPGRKRGRCMQVSNTRNFILADCICGMSPSWNLHFIYSKDIITCGCQVLSHGIANGDGWDPDSSINCILFDTILDTGDDCVAIKSGKNPEGNEINRSCEHIKVFDVVANGGWGVAIGSEMSGGVNDVKLWNLNMKKTSVGFYIKAPIERGGYVKNVELKNSSAPRVSISQKSMYNPSGDDATTPSVVENITLEDLYLGGIDYFDSGKHDWFAISIDSKDDYKGLINNVSISDILLNRRNLKPNQEFYFKNVSGIKLKNIKSK